MARSSFDLIVASLEDGNQTAVGILTANGYQQKNLNGEIVWQNGIGFLTAKKFIKLEAVSANLMKVYGWVAPVGGGDMDLDGFVGAIPKKQVLKVIQKIQAAVG